MCGRVIVNWQEVLEVSGDTELAAWMRVRPQAATSSWNISPTGRLPVALTSTKTGERRLEMAHWSLVPPWSPSMKLTYPTFNARIETVAQKPTFRGPLKQQRCVIPVSGFYEWTGAKGSRTPYAIFGPQSLLPLAGLYSWWRDPATTGIEAWHLTTTILTQPSTGVMAPLHDRMPVFVDGANVHDWLNPDLFGGQALTDQLAHTSARFSEQLRAYEVRPLKGDGPSLIEPAPQSS
jgi:putative SOS response-associated peptidase YedK